MRFQPIYDIAEICALKHVTDAVLCPGSRCAPLTLAFTRHPTIDPKTFSDERSAGFIALGLAQQKQKPVAIICTSGTAVYNLAPAVAEAFFSETPLIVLTADRPSEWIAQHDGQTIHQTEVFGKHVKKFFQLPQDYDHPDSKWAINRIVNDAINLSLQHPRGPVHINAPFREPLYPEPEEKTSYSPDIRIINAFGASGELSNEQKSFIQQAWRSYHRVLVVAGQHPSDVDLDTSLRHFFQKHKLPFVGDIISNQHHLVNNTRYADLFLGQASEDVKKSLQPDLLITFGQSLISKNLKLYLRKYAPKAHWHLQLGGVAVDTFKNLTTIFDCAPVSFFGLLASLPEVESFENQKQQNYAKLWEVETRRAERVINQFFPTEKLNEAEIVRDVLATLPAGCNLHLANSMSVRYANFFGLNSTQDVRVFANRGTSGIDGCTSTSVGHYLAYGKPTFLISGDLAFFYDRNAFWHNYPLENLRILLLNNHGGLIFNIIDGPASVPERDEYFVTRQKLNARKLCEEFGFVHLQLDSRKKLKNLLKDFFDFDGRTKILELESDVHLNKTIFDELKRKIKISYDI